MPSTMCSCIAVLFTLAASALAAPEPTTTAALQSLLSISNIDAAQAHDISTMFEADKASYYGKLTTEPAYKSAFSVAATGMPMSAMTAVQPNPDLFLASVAQASSDDLPSWFASLPADVQNVWKSVGRQNIEMFTSAVAVVRPMSSDVAASVSSAQSSASSAISSASSAISSASSAITSAVSEGLQKGAAPASPVTSGNMGVVAAGVAIAAGLVGMALL
ncbi:MAG: hypothetical protein Q9178_001738 [Gyalolechia marmorata]